MEIINDLGFLLTFNYQTKICCDKILLDHNGNISNLQWYSFQLHEICKFLKIDYHDEFNSNTLTNMILGQRIQETIKKKTISLPLHEKYRKLGLISDNNSNLSQVYYQVIVENNRTIKGSYNKPRPRDTYSKLTCEFGKLRNYDGAHCYMDTIFMLLLVNTPENKFSKLLAEKVLPNSPEIKKIYENINQTNKPFTIQEYVDTISDKYGKIFKITGRQNDSSEFLGYLLNRFQDLIKVIGYNYSINYYFFNKGDISNKTLTELKKESIIDRSVMDESNPIFINSLPIRYLENIQDDSLEYKISEFLSTHDVSRGNFLKTQRNWKVMGDDDKGHYLFNIKDSRRLDLEPDSNGYKFPGKDFTIRLYDRKDDSNGDLVATNANTKIEETVINKADFLILNLIRYPIGSQEIDTTSIIPDEKISLSGKILNLVAIETFTGVDNKGHYFGYFLCHGKWYKYNDIARDVVSEIADNYQDLIEKQKDYICQMGIIFFYC